MNNCNFIGRITKDLELKYFGNNIACLKFSLAVDRKFKQDGKPTTDFLNCTAWGKTAEFMGKYLNKGSKIGVNARVEMGSYDKDGVKIYTTDFIVENVTFCESKSQKSEYQLTPADLEDPNMGTLDDPYDDELPF